MCCRRRRRHREHGLDEPRERHALGAARVAPHLRDESVLRVGTEEDLGDVEGERVVAKPPATEDELDDVISDVGREAGYEEGLSAEGVAAVGGMEEVGRG